VRVQRDYLGNPVSGENPATLAAIDAFVGGLLGYEERLLGVVAAATADPGSCLANAYAGWICMFLESPAAPAHAAGYLERARRAAPGATPREQHATELLAAWAADDLDAATRAADAALAAAPRDLAALKLHQHFSFNRGRFPAMLRVAQNALPGDFDEVPCESFVRSGLDAKIDRCSTSCVDFAVDSARQGQIRDACRSQSDAEPGRNQAHQSGPLRSILDDVGAESISFAAGDGPVKGEGSHPASEED